MEDARAFTYWFLRDLRGLAILGVSLAATVFLLSSVLVLLFGIEPSATQSESSAPLKKFLVVVFRASGLNGGRSGMTLTGLNL